MNNPSNWSEHFGCNACSKDVPCGQHVAKAANIELSGWVEPVDGVGDMAGPKEQVFFSLNDSVSFMDPDLGELGI